MSLELIGRVTAGEDLTQAEAASAIGQMMDGAWPDEQVALLLTALHHKGESVDEVAGAAEAMRQHMTRIRSQRTQLLDTCGTGGDGSGTFNISTAAALVIASAGVAVAKHGNRSMTSKTGSADVLAELGVNIDASVEQAERCLDELGICFCFAPSLHRSMKNVAHVRKQLGIRTIFNLLGPLCNPADAGFQLLGVGRPALRPLMAQALSRLGADRAIVVCGEDGLDEVTLRGATRCTQIGSSYREFAWTPADFGLQATQDFNPLLVDGPQASAKIIQRVLKGEPGTARDIVVINAAAGIWTVKQNSLDEAVAQACEAIDSGATQRLLDKLAEASHRD